MGDSRTSEDRRILTFFFFVSPVAAGHARSGVRAEEERKRDRSGGRGNGKSARYYAPLTLPEKEGERYRGEKNGGFSFSRSGTPRIIRAERYSNISEVSICLRYKVKGMSFLRDVL